MADYGEHAESDHIQAQPSNVIHCLGGIQQYYFSCLFLLGITDAKI